MSEKIYLNLLILCGILSQGIIGILMEDNYKNSSNIHLRKKRVIDDSTSGFKIWSITEIPYIVKVLQNGTQICAGIIVSPEHILTIKVCVDEPDVTMSIESGTLSMNNIEIHHVKDMIFNGHLALLVINPIISFESPSLNRNILLHGEPIEPRTVISISGWAKVNQYRLPTTTFRRSTFVSVMGLSKCTDYYARHEYQITNDYICTVYRNGDRGCTYEDGGSALVLNNELVGVLIFAGRIISPGSPDVFVRVNGNDNPYHVWIMSFIAPYLHHQVNIPSLQPHNMYPHSQHLHNQVPLIEYSHPHTSYNQGAYSQYPHVQNPHIQYPHIQYPHIQYPHIQNPHIQHPHIQYPHASTSHNEYSQGLPSHNQDPHNQYSHSHKSPKQY